VKKMNIAVLPGDDIGPEITDATLAVLQVADKEFGLNLKLDIHETGMAAHRRLGTTLPDQAFNAAQSADGILLGPAGITNYPPVHDGGINIPATIRKKLELFANIRPARFRAGVLKSLPGLDCVIVRENTEGFYADRTLYKGYGEFMPTPDCALSLRLITAAGSRRIAKVAFRVARNRRKQLTMVGKRHVLQITDGLFMGQAMEEARDYPDVTVREVDIDAMAAELYTHPEKTDVLLTTNMFGDILSNEVVALSGGLGLAAALNVGDKHAAANAGHGSAPDIAGQGIANPTGLILSSALLLRWFGETRGKAVFVAAAGAIEGAIDETYKAGAVCPSDFGGKSSTTEFARAVSSAIRGGEKRASGSAS
jgi:isocitrate/isopropylmalate dehydrogenase